MDFLKSAVASAMAKGPPFPYTFGDKQPLDPSIWTLHNGTRREDGSNCSIFSFDVTTGRALLPLARNALKKLRTLRHPGVIKVLDTVETDTYIYIATERLVPLRWHVSRQSITPETAKWGLYSIARTLKFVNGEATSIHGLIKVGSIFTSESGEWKLGGFEILSSVKDDEAVIYNYGTLVPGPAIYRPPELATAGYEAIKRSPHTAVDSYGFAELIYEVFNGNFYGTDQLTQPKSVPPSMQSSYKRLITANPKSRISVSNFLDQGLRSGSFFDTPLIKLTDGVDNLGVKSAEERDEFLDDLGQLTDDFPEDYFIMKVLPELLKSVEFGGGGPKAFALVMSIANKLSSDDFNSKITPVIIRLFGLPDRAIRVCLLDSLPLMIDKLPQKVVNDKIFPNMVTGFADQAPVVREQTLKSVLTIITKLSDRTINGELLRHLAKTANDEQPGIRTNTTICLGKIAKNLGTSSRAKVLTAAFSRSLRDPFVHARNAALLALGATVEYFSDDDCAAKILPAICPLLLDKEKLVRDQANKSMDIFLHKIRKAASSMPDSVLPPPSSAAESGPRMSTPQPAESAAVAWAGWAISSFTNKISAAAGEIQPSTNGSSSLAPSAAKVDAKRPGSALRTASASNLHRQALKSPPASAPMSRAATQDNSFTDAEPEAEAEPDAADQFNAEIWGDMEEMDDEADNDANGDAWGTASNAWGSVAGDEPSAASSTKSPTPSITTAKRKEVTAKPTTAPRPAPVASATPFGDDEPDFAGWLAAQQASKKGPGAKALPKGLAKTTAPANSATGAKKPAAKPVVAKKIDLKPKADNDDNGGWGDGW